MQMQECNSIGKYYNAITDLSIHLNIYKNKNRQHS